jgi:dUTPase
VRRQSCTPLFRHSAKNPALRQRDDRLADDQVVDDPYIDKRQSAPQTLGHHDVGARRLGNSRWVVVHERVEFPIGEEGRCLAGRVEGKSSYARCGLLIHFTAPTIHAGFSGTITLELCNLGPANISLYPGMPICQLIVEAVEGVPFRNDSQFQGQRAVGGHVPIARREHQVGL